jgi:uncharacterized protein YkwD
MTTTTTARPRSRRLASVVASALAVGVLLTGCLTADQQADFDLVNAKRKANGKVALSEDTVATNKAQAWSDHMARTGVLEHTGGGLKLDPSGLGDWCAMGENVGRGASVKVIHDAFYASAPHKTTMLGNYRTLGVGVTKSGSTYWVTEIYVRYC